jgi:hypothetical protein
MSRAWNVYKPLAYFVVFSLLLLGLSRCAMAAWQFERIAATNDWLSFWVGALRIDLSTVGYLLILPTLINLSFG